MADALANLVKRKAAANPLLRMQGLKYPWNADTSTTQHKGAMLMASDIDPNYLWIKFREIVKYHMYNTSNVTAYITIIKKIPKKSSNAFYQPYCHTLMMYPQAETDTPLQKSTLTGYFDKTKGNLLAWGYPAWNGAVLSSAPAAGSAICPFVPTAGADKGSLFILREWGAFQQFFQSNSNMFPSFLQQHSQNMFNLGPTLDTVAVTAPDVILDQNQSNTSYAQDHNLAIQSFNGKVSGTGIDPAYYYPLIGSNYFSGNTAPTAAATTAGDTGQRGQAYTTVNTDSTGDSYSTAEYDHNMSQQRQFFSGSGPTNIDASTALVKGNNMQDPFSADVAGGSGYNWSKHPQYNEMRNKSMRMMFKMHKRRVTIPPGKVLRWTFKSRKASINPVRHNLIREAYSTAAITVPHVFSYAANNSKTIDGWGSSDSTLAFPNIPQYSMWGPGMPCRTKVWSMAMRGQTAVNTTFNANKAQIMPTEILIKKDHIIKYNVKYNNMTRDLKNHATIRNFLAYQPSISDYKIQYPIAGVISGGAAATTVSTAAPVNAAV